MLRTESYFIALPEDVPVFNDGVRVAPNEGTFPLDATVKVWTEDEHMLTFQIVPKAPARTDFLISLVESDPPLSEDGISENDIYVEEDKLIKGREFWLASAVSGLAKRAFVAAAITSNVVKIELPIL